MYSSPHRYLFRMSRQARLLVVISLTVASFAFLAALPTIPAQASPASASSATITVSGLPTGEVEKLLGEVPLGSSGVPLSDLEVPQLAKLLAQLKGISGLSGLGGLGGTSGLEQTLTKAIDELVAGKDKLGELLNPAVLGPKLESALSGLLGPTWSTLVETLLHKSPSAIINEGLGSVHLDELLGSLLNSASNPEQLLSKLFAALEPAKLESLLHSNMTGEFVKTTAGELAQGLETNGLETTTEALAKKLGTTLTSATMALTAPLQNGEELGVVNGVHGLTAGLLDRVLGSGSSGGEGGGSGGSGGGSSGGSGGSGGSGSPGGSGGNGSSGGDSGSGSGNGSSGGSTPGTTSVVVNLPSTTPVPRSGSTPAKVGSVEIVSHRVRGRRVTLVVQVPAAGKLTVGGPGLRSAHRQAATAERIVIATVLTRAGISSLHHHHRLHVTLHAAFIVAGGPASSADAIVSFS
jgi:hypothetical protein